MYKNNKGITLTILVITIVIMLILATITMSINININKTVDLKTIVANMELIKTAAQAYADKYFEGTSADGEDIINSEITLPGIKNGISQSIITRLLNEIRLEDEEIVVSNYWYMVDNDALKTMNIDLTLNGNERYFIDYKNMNVAYIKDTNLKNNKYPGFIDRNGHYLYFYEQLKNVKTDQLGN